MIMKRTINNYLLSALAVAALGFGACSKWTETESLTLHYPNLEEQNPELYEQYMQSLRDYKASEHKIVLAMLNNTGMAPGRQNEHLTIVPDSVDYICMANPAGMHPMLVEEIPKVHEKGTRVIYNIDYAVIEARWKKILEEEEANKPVEPEVPEVPEESALLQEGEEPTEPTPEEILEERFLNFIGEQVTLYLSYCAQFGFDGVVACYEGAAPESMPEPVKVIHTARQAAFLSPMKAWLHMASDKQLLFQGSPANLIDKSVLDLCEYIVIPALKASSGDQLSYAVLMASVAGVPTDRFIVGVTTPSLTDPTDESGYFTGLDVDGTSKLRAIKGAAQWVVAPDANFTKSGIAITNAQNDYFNITFVYKNIRESIDIMNPAPKN